MQPLGNRLDGNLGRRKPVGAREFLAVVDDVQVESRIRRDPSEVVADMLPAEATVNDNGGSLGAERIISLPLREAREVFEREYLNAQMLRFSGNISRTANFIGMERSALHRKLKALGLGETRGEGGDQGG